LQRIESGIMFYVPLVFTYAAKRHIWPAIGNPNEAWAGRQGFLEKNTTWSERNLRSMAKRKVEIFY